MKFVIQRVAHAEVAVEGEVIGKIGKGFMVLIGVAQDDTREIADKMVKKLTGLRIFEDENGEVDNIFEDEVPYDLNAPVIEIRREDYGIWYAELYLHKELEFKAQAFRPKSMEEDMFVPVRKIMTCCADDTSFLGYVCRSPYAPKLKPGDWVKVRAKVSFKNLSVYRGEGPVLDAENIEPAEPIEEMVYFN